MSTVKRVLVFDDDADLLDIFRFLFEDSGWQVYTFETCDELISKATEIHPDLILMDNWIPPQGGISATQLLKNDALLKEIPVIFVSANNDVKELSIKAGADAYIEKPFDFDVLMDRANLLTNKI
jgi:two-component system cell cycle response regulator DivK